MAAGFGSSTFVAASNDMCILDGVRTLSYYYLPDLKLYCRASSKYDATITADCETLIPAMCGFGSFNFSVCLVVAGAQSAALAVFGILSLIFIWYCHVSLRRPFTGSFAKDVSWRIAGREDGREAVVWDFDVALALQHLGIDPNAKDPFDEVAPDAFDAEREIWCAMVDFDIDSDTNRRFDLKAVFSTRSDRKEDFLCGRAFVGEFELGVGGPGCAKVLSLQAGTPVFEMPGLGALRGKRPLNDGQQHAVVVRASVDGDEGDQEMGGGTATYVLEVDGVVEDTRAFGCSLAVDHPGALWLSCAVLKTGGEAMHQPSASGHLVHAPSSQLSSQSGGDHEVHDSSFLGEIDSITFNGFRVRDPVAEAEAKEIGHVLPLRYTKDAALADMTPRKRVDGIRAYQAHTTVEYFSVTNSQWVLGSILGFKQEADGLGACVHITYDVQLRHNHRRYDVELSLLRGLLRPGEPIVVYDEKQHVWMDARAARTQPLDVSTVGYRVFLQSDLGTLKASNGSPFSRKAPPVAHKIPSHLIRRRFPLGAKVRFYQDAQSGWVSATVEKLESVTFEPKAVKVSGQAQSRSNTPRGAAAASADLKMPTGYSTDSRLYPITVAKTKLSDGTERQLPVALWETASIRLEGGEQLVVGTFRLMMEPEEWGYEAVLPAAEEDEEEHAALHRGAGADCRLADAPGPTQSSANEETVSV